MRNQEKHFINGEWIASTGNETTEVINPATEEVIGTISLGTKEDLDKAVKGCSYRLPFFLKNISK